MGDHGRSRAIAGHAAGAAGRGEPEGVAMNRSGLSRVSFTFGDASRFETPGAPPSAMPAGPAPGALPPIAPRASQAPQSRPPAQARPPQHAPVQGPIRPTSGPQAGSPVGPPMGPPPAAPHPRPRADPPGGTHQDPAAQGQPDEASGDEALFGHFGTRFARGHA